MEIKLSEKHGLSGKLLPSIQDDMSQDSGRLEELELRVSRLEKSMMATLRNFAPILKEEVSSYSHASTSSKLNVNAVTPVPSTMAATVSNKSSVIVSSVPMLSSTSSDTSLQPEESVPVYPSTLIVSAQDDHTATSDFQTEAKTNARDCSQRNDTASHQAFGKSDARMKMLTPKEERLEPVQQPKPSSVHSAVQKGHLQMAEALLDDGADLNTQDADEATALSLAAAEGNVQAVKLLLKRGATVNIRDGTGLTPLQTAASHGQMAVLILLADEEMSGDIYDGSEWGTAAFHAAKAKHWDIVKYLLDKGGSPMTCDKRGESLLLVAAECGNLEIVNLLLEKGVPIDLTDKEGDTALLRAARTGFWSVVEVLLNKGASSLECNSRLESALEAASRNGRDDIVLALLLRGAAADTVLVGHALKSSSNAAVVKAFVEAAPTSIQGVTGEEALRHAASSGRRDAMVALLEAGVDPDARCRFGLTTLRYSGWRALHYAAWMGKATCVEALLERGADKNSKTNYGDTPLHLASMNDCENCVRLLVTAGADISEMNERRHTPPDVARSQAVKEILRKGTYNSE